MASEDPVELPAQGLVTTRPHFGLSTHYRLSNSRAGR